MPNSCDLPVILTGGGRSSAMPPRPSRHGEPIVCAVRRTCGAARAMGAEPAGIRCAERVAPRPARPLASPLASPLVRPNPPMVAALESPDEEGSQTTEYALLLILAATMTTIAVAWAKQGGVKSLFDGVLGQVLALLGVGAG